MLTYNTTYTVGNEDARNFVIWIHQVYLARTAETGMLSNPRMLRVLNHKDEETECFCVQFDVESSAILHRWYQQQGHALNQEMLQMFGNRVVGFSTMMEVIEG